MAHFCMSFLRIFKIWNCSNPTTVRSRISPRSSDSTDFRFIKSLSRAVFIKLLHIAFSALGTVIWAGFKLCQFASCLLIFHITSSLVSGVKFSSNKPGIVSALSRFIASSSAIMDISCCLISAIACCTVANTHVAFVLSKAVSEDRAHGWVTASNAPGSVTLVSSSHRMVPIASRCLRKAALRQNISSLACMSTGDLLGSNTGSLVTIVGRVRVYKNVSHENR